jgi:small subunit ribosomal protein S6
LTSYEILLLLDPEQAEARQDEIVARAREQVEKGGGTWQSHDAWGRRRLAYPIAKQAEGVYHLLVFDADGATLDEISRVLKIDDAVLRHMATRHIAGSRTGAPRDDGSAPPAPAAAPAAPTDEAPADEAPADEPPADEAPADEAPADEPEADVSASEEPEYAPAEEEPAEVPAQAGSDAGEADIARPETNGEKE